MTPSVTWWGGYGSLRTASVSTPFLGSYCSRYKDFPTVDQRGSEKNRHSVSGIAFCSCFFNAWRHMSQLCSTTWSIRKAMTQASGLILFHDANSCSFWCPSFHAFGAAYKHLKDIPFTVGYNRDVRCCVQNSCTCLHAFKLAITLIPTKRAASCCHQSVQWVACRQAQRTLFEASIATVAWPTMLFPDPSSRKLVVSWTARICKPSTPLDVVFCAFSTIFLWSSLWFSKTDQSEPHRRDCRRRYAPKYQGQPRQDGHAKNVLPVQTTIPKIQPWFFYLYPPETTILEIDSIWQTANFRA